MADAQEIIGGYRLRKCLQSGQTSQVYEVIEPSSNRHFAMKILLPEHSDKPDVRKTLFHEASVGIKMRHENVINILKISKDAKSPHFIMEYFPGGDLRGRLLSPDPRDKQFVKTNAKKIFKQVATGLAYMNSSGYVHCDVKPGNILVNALAQAKIIDFAITRKVQKKGVLAKLFGKRDKKVSGTYSYMSPEQIKGENIDGRADIYSYGATVYEAVCGRPPFRGASVEEILKKHLGERPPSAMSYNPDVTKEFSAYLDKLLAKKRDERPPSFHNVIVDLKKLQVFTSLPDGEDEYQ